MIRSFEKFRILLYLPSAPEMDSVMVHFRRYPDIETEGVIHVSELFNLLADDDFDLVIAAIDGAAPENKHLIQEVRKIRRSIPVVVISSAAEPERILDSLRQGALDYLIRPLDEEKVHSILNNYRQDFHDSRLIARMDRFIEKKMVRMTIPTDVNLLPHIAQRITDDIFDTAIFEDSLRYNLNLAIFECLSNALEHGNLEVTYEEKTENIQLGNYLDKLRLRSSQEPFRNRKIRVKYFLNEEGVRISIRDEGAGFDVRGYTEKTGQKSNEDFHGRGLLLAMNMVSSLTFNSRGNEVILKLNRDKSAD